MTMTDLDQITRARYLSRSGLGKQARLGAEASLADIQAEMRDRGWSYSIANLSRIENGIRRPFGDAGRCWGQIIDELLDRGRAS